MLTIAAGNQSTCLAIARQTTYKTVQKALRLQCMESDNFTGQYIIRYLSAHELVLRSPLSLQCKQGGVIHICSVHCNQAVVYTVTKL